MKNTIKILLLAAFAQPVFGQNLFPVKLDNCNTSSFCLDCGDIKGGFEENQFQEMLDKVESKINLKGVSGSVYFQVLVDAKGKGCVLSHTDQSNSYITKTLIQNLNKFKYWTPATTDGITEDKTSINLIVTIKDNNLSGLIERVSIPAFKESLRGSRPPEIYNEHYTYKNEHLEDYQISTWHRENSDLVNDQNDNIAIDSIGVLWYTMDNSLGIMKDETFMKFEQNIQEDGGNGLHYSALAIDNNNTTWVSTSTGIFSYDGKWNFHSPNKIGIDGAYKIINNKLSGEVFFCSDEGLTIYSNGVWSNINQDSILELPSNRVYFAKRDSKNRLWIGTFSGSIMIDSNGVVTNFNKESKTPLFERCVDALTEDEKGNIYMGIYQFGPKGSGVVNRDEGLIIYSIDGTWKQFTTENSGLPFNNITNLAYSESILWIATDRAGLVRYDLKENWENYHSENSNIPTSYISDIEIDSNGVIYLGTRLGLVRIEKK